jgi:hypothetical protein
LLLVELAVELQPPTRRPTMTAPIMTTRLRDGNWWPGMAVLPSTRGSATSGGKDLPLVN